jgi:hypothetical protein
MTEAILTVILSEPTSPTLFHWKPWRWLTAYNQMSFLWTSPCRRWMESKPQTVVAYPSRCDGDRSLDPNRERGHRVIVDPVNAQTWVYATSLPMRRTSLHPGMSKDEAILKGRNFCDF